LVIVSNAQRTYYGSAGQLQDRPNNVYYHINTGCMKRQQAYFMASQVQIPHSIKDMLTPVHRLYIREFGLDLRKMLGCNTRAVIYVTSVVWKQ
jgi:hypothetical protein